MNLKYICLTQPIQAGGTLGMGATKLIRKADVEELFIKGNFVMAVKKGKVVKFPLANILFFEEEEEPIVTNE